MDEASHAFGMGFHPHEHPPDIRMFDNGHGFRIRIEGFSQIPSLDALPGVI